MGRADLLKIAVLTPRPGMETKRIFSGIATFFSFAKAAFCEYAPIYLGNWRWRCQQKSELLKTS
jgi:hypothetical protein